MSKYTPEELQLMAKMVLDNTGTMEYIALLQIVSALSGLDYPEVIQKIENLAKCGKEECE